MTVSYVASDVGSGALLRENRHPTADQLRAASRLRGGSEHQRARHQVLRRGVWVVGRIRWPLGDRDWSAIATSECRPHGEGAEGLAMTEAAIPKTDRDYVGLRSSRRRSWALMATITVEALISTAAAAGARTIPAQAKAPAASGMAATL